MKTLITEEQIREKVLNLAEIIANDNKSGKIHVLFVLKGAFIFCADVIRALCSHNLDVTVDYLIAESYSGKESAGEVKTYINIDIKGKEVLLLEDIIDTGRTIKTLKEKLLEMHPEHLKTICLLDKPSRRIVDIDADYVGFKIKDKFVVGYGLDYDEKFRYLPYIAEIE